MALSLSTCGELSYKRDASENDFQKQKNNFSTDNKTDIEV
jgi:IS4 transposase